MDGEFLSHPFSLGIFSRDDGSVKNSVVKGDTCLPERPYQLRGTLFGTQNQDTFAGSLRNQPFPKLFCIVALRHIGRIQAAFL